MTRPGNARLYAAIDNIFGMPTQPGPEFVERMDSDVSDRLCELVGDSSHAWHDWKGAIAAQAADEAMLRDLCEQARPILERMQARGMDVENALASVDDLLGWQPDHTGIAEKVIDSWGRGV